MQSVFLWLRNQRFVSRNILLVILKEDENGVMRFLPIRGDISY